MAEKSFLSPLEEFKGVNGRTCCLTGDFNYGSKDKVKVFIQNLGGRISSGVGKETTVLIVGEKGNANWAHGKYGRKVEVALLARQEGKEICIIAEDDFFRLIKDMPDGGQPPETKAAAPAEQYNTTELLAMAKECFDDVVNGVLPVTDPEVEDTMVYVSGILETLLEEKWKPKYERKRKQKETRKRPFFITRSEASAYEVKDTPQSPYGMALALSAIHPAAGMYRCSAWIIKKWLIAKGFLTEQETEEGKIVLPTDQGKEIGIEMANGPEKWDAAYVVLNSNAQRFVIDHIEEICLFSARQ